MEDLQAEGSKIKETMLGKKKKRVENCKATFLQRMARGLIRQVS